MTDDSSPSTDKSNNHNLIVGKIGLGLTSFLWLITCQRLWFQFHSRRRRPHSNQQGRQYHESRTSSLVSSLSPRRTFHILIWIAMTTEMMAYTDLAGIHLLLHATPCTQRMQIETIGHVLLDMIGRAMMEYIAFAVVTLLWFHTTGDALQQQQQRDHGHRVSSSGSGTTSTMAHHRPSYSINMMIVGPKVLKLSCAILSIASLVEASSALYFGFSSSSSSSSSTSASLSLDDYYQTSIIYRIHLFIEGLAWGIHGCIVLYIIHKTTQSILRLIPTLMTQQQRHAQQNSYWNYHRYRLDIMKLLGKPLVPMILCATCYMVRFLWLFALLDRSLLVPSKQHPPSGSSSSSSSSALYWGYWIGFVWLPTIIPTIMVLYSARKRDTSLLNSIQRDRTNTRTTPRNNNSSNNNNSQNNNGYDSPDHHNMALSESFLQRLPTPAPPAEAFHNFRQVLISYNDDDDDVDHDDDDDYNIGSTRGDNHDDHDDVLLFSPMLPRFIDTPPQPSQEPQSQNSMDNIGEKGNKDHDVEEQHQEQEQKEQSEQSYVPPPVLEVEHPQHDNAKKDDEKALAEDQSTSSR